MRESIARVSEGSAVLVALSGGADSLALAAAVAYEAPRAGVVAGAVIVDHGLQAGLAEVAARAAEQAVGLGLDPVLVHRVSVVRDRDGVEAAAREARYSAIAEAAVAVGASALLTAHTRDDQAEQVLLALARGSGLRSLAGIPSERELAGAPGVRLLRPFLSERAGVTRRTTEQACAEQSLDPWCDPHNSDPVYTRVRVRDRVLPMLETELGPGVADALARTADLAREDADALDALAAQTADSSVELIEGGDASGVAIPIATLAPLPQALRNRVIRHLARERFDAHLTRERTLAIAALVTDWRGQGPIEAPGLTVRRAGDALVMVHS